MKNIINNYKFISIGLVVFLLTLLLLPIAAFAEGVTPESNAIAIDTVWVLLAAFLVFLMQAGFAMVETGFTRAKNAANIVMKNLMDFASGSIIFWLIGFGIMFGKDLGGFIGTSGWVLTSNFEHLGLSIPLFAFLIFQTVFCLQLPQLFRELWLNEPNLLLTSSTV
ncbi:MAG: ammonium transporter, Amt family [Clostridia bacterium]|nr:ammonium transporter, Amt family [Clostridia bacterium]